MRERTGKALGAKQGVVKWFRNERGYGFIVGSDGNDYFVHFSGIIRPPGAYASLQQDSRVEFQGWEGDDGGLFATEVVPVVGFGLKREKKI